MVYRYQRVAFDHRGLRRLTPVPQPWRAALF